ncbi:MAG: prealbumin-like fold domain-containing protein [Bacteroidota bacterium]
MIRTLKILNLLVALALTSCEKNIEFQENGITMVTIVDEWTYNPIPNATVKIYKQFDDWAFERNLIKTVKTDSKGQVKFKDLSDGEYYLDVVKDDLSNWQYLWGIPVYRGELYVQDIPISVNFNYVISSVEGKDWEITNIYDEFDNEISNDPNYACIIGNILHFEKAGYYTMDDGVNQCDTLPQFQEGNWWGYGQNLSIVTNNSEYHDYFIDPFFDEYFILTDLYTEKPIKFRYERR